MIMKSTVEKIEKKECHDFNLHDYLAKILELKISDGREAAWTCG